MEEGKKQFNLSKTLGPLSDEQIHRLATYFFDRWQKGSIDRLYAKQDACEINTYHNVYIDLNNWQGDFQPVFDWRGTNKWNKNNKVRNRQEALKSVHAVQKAFWNAVGWVDCYPQNSDWCRPDSDIFDDADDWEEPSVCMKYTHIIDGEVNGEIIPDDLWEIWNYKGRNYKISHGMAKAYAKKKGLSVDDVLMRFHRVRRAQIDELEEKREMDIDRIQKGWL